MSNSLLVAALCSVATVAVAVALTFTSKNRKRSTAIVLPPKKLKFRICVYCGSKAGNVPEFEAQAMALGRAFNEFGVELVYGGGSIGIMGAIARSVHDGGGIVHSVIPKALMKYTGEIIQPHNCIVTRGMHDRKQCFHDLCDAFIALPGGLGTVEELMETATWAQLGVHNKPFGVLNTLDFYGPLRAMFAKQIELDFVDPVWADGGLVFRFEAVELLTEVLKLVEINKASASQIPAHEWNV